MEDLEKRLSDFLTPEEYKQVVLQEKNIFEIFPTAAELTQQKLKEEDEDNLWKIYLQLQDTRSRTIKYEGMLSSNCLEYLRSKGYQVYPQWHPPVIEGGDCTIYYDISY